MECDKITKRIYAKLIENMSRRVVEVIRTKGSHIKY
jgi:alpha-L-arabinofuranosidase